MMRSQIVCREAAMAPLRRYGPQVNDGQMKWLYIMKGCAIHLALTLHSFELDRFRKDSIYT
jgi:hypothetical protein